MQELVTQIINLEWAMFQNVKNEGGTASCQQNREAFVHYRRAMLLAWDDKTQALYLQDLTDAEKSGVNLLAAKYGYMMHSSSPREYEKIRHLLPPISTEKKKLVAEIMVLHNCFYQELLQKYPELVQGGRPASSSEDTPDWVSFETYQTCELYTYSMDTLGSYLLHLNNLKSSGQNINELVLRNSLTDK